MNQTKTRLNPLDIMTSESTSVRLDDDSTSMMEAGCDEVCFQREEKSAHLYLLDCLIKKYKCMIMLIILLLATAELISSIVVKMDTSTFERLTNAFINITTRRLGLIDSMPLDPDDPSYIILHSEK